MSGDINYTINFKSANIWIKFLFYVLGFFKKEDSIQGGTLFKWGHNLSSTVTRFWKWRYEINSKNWLSCLHSKRNNNSCSLSLTKILLMLLFFVKIMQVSRIFSRLNASLSWLSSFHHYLVSVGTVHTPKLTI